jgi:hypothetical protein
MCMFHRQVFSRAAVHAVAGGKLLPGIADHRHWSILAGHVRLSKPLGRPVSTVPHRMGRTYKTGDTTDGLAQCYHSSHESSAF